MARKFYGTKAELVAELKQRGVEVLSERNIANAVQLNTRCGAKINLFTNRTLQFQGHNAWNVEKAWDESEAASND